MNAKPFTVLTTHQLATIEGGIPAGWYAPYGYISDNLICRNGYRPTQANFKNGNCGTNWEAVVNNTVANMSMALGGLHSNRP